MSLREAFCDTFLQNKKIRKTLNSGFSILSLTKCLQHSDFPLICSKLDAFSTQNNIIYWNETQQLTHRIGSSDQYKPRLMTCTRQLFNRTLTIVR